MWRAHGCLASAEFTKKCMQLPEQGPKPILGMNANCPNSGDTRGLRLYTTGVGLGGLQRRASPRRVFLANVLPVVLDEAVKPFGHPRDQPLGA